MNSQMKDRKSRRRFARLMSLALSTSLVLGNVVFAYAGVENPNVPLSEGPNVSIEEEVIAEGNVTSSGDSQNPIDIAVSSDYKIVSVDVSPNSVTMNPVDNPEDVLSLDKASFELLSGNVVSGDKNEPLISKNQLELKKVQLKEGVSVNRTTSGNLEAIIAIKSGVSGSDGKYYTGQKTVELSENSLSWNDEGSSSEKAISIDYMALEVSANVINETVKLEELDSKKAEIEERLKNNGAVIVKAWSTSEVVVPKDKLLFSVKWGTDGKTADLVVSTNGTVSHNELYFKGEVTKESIVQITVQNSGGDDGDISPSGNLVDISDTSKVSVNVAVADPKTESVSTNDAAAITAALDKLKNRISANVVSKNGAVLLNKNDLNVELSVNGTVSKDSTDNVCAKVSVKNDVVKDGVSYNGTVEVANVAGIVLSENGGGSVVDPNPPTPTVNELSVSPIKTDWDGKKVTISSDTVTTYALYLTDKAVVSDADLKGLTPVSANRALVSKNDVYTTSEKDVNKYIVARISGNVISSCYVDKAALSKVTLDNTNIQMEIKDGKIVKGTLPKVLSVNDKKSPSANTSANSFEVKWAIDAAKAKKGDDVKVSVAPASTNQYYTGSQTVTVGKVASVTTTTTKPTTKKDQSMKVTPTSLTFKVGDTKAKTLKVKNAKGAITVTVDKKGKKVIKVTPNKAKTSIKVVPKTKKAAGVATITIKAAGDKTYKAATKKVTVTVMPKQKPTAKVSGVKVVSKKTKTAKVTWKAIKNDKKVNGYQIQYAASKKALSKGTIVTVTGAKKATYTIKKLKKGKKVFVRVRAVNTKNGASNPSKKWSAVKSCKVK